MVGISLYLSTAATHCNLEVGVRLNRLTNLCIIVDLFIDQTFVAVFAFGLTHVTLNHLFVRLQYISYMHL